MNDAEFREQYKPVHVPAAFNEAESLRDKVVFALAEINEGSADAVARKLEELEPEATIKQVIAEVHQTLSDLYNKGLIAGHDDAGGLVYNLYKITQANNGKVNPNLLAPGLD